MSSQPKYMLLYSRDTDSLEEKINRFSDEYSLREIVPAYEGLIASMGLREDSKYDNIVKFRCFPITTEEQTLPEGWTIIHHTSKELIGVKKKHDGEGKTADTQTGVGM